MDDAGPPEYKLYMAIRKKIIRYKRSASWSVVHISTQNDGTIYGGTFVIAEKGQDNPLS